MGKVSVIIPIYNSMRTLQRCVDSILAQTYPVHEIILTDNGSTDNTSSFFSNYHEKVKYYDMGAGCERCFKKNDAGMNKAIGDYLLFIDSDMHLDASVIEECVKEIAKGHITVVIPERSFGEGFWSQCKVLEKECYIGDILVESARFVKKTTFIQINGYDPLLIAAEDMDFHNRMVEHGSCGRIKSFIHHDEGRLSLNKTVEKKSYYGETFEIYKQKYPELSKKQFGAYRLLSFLKNYKLLLQHPILTFGLFFMKGREYFAFKNSSKNISAIKGNKVY